jgi:hypothetical protein
VLDRFGRVEVVMVVVGCYGHCGGAMGLTSSFGAKVVVIVRVVYT